MPDTNFKTTEQKRQLAILRANLHKAVAQASDEMVPLEDISIRPTPKKLAGRMVVAPKFEKSQVRQLETLAYTTNKISDITDWLKRQIGRDSRNRNWGNDRIGTDVMTALEGLNERAEKIAKDVNANDKDLPRRVHLELCREFVKHLAAEFLYNKKGED